MKTQIKILLILFFFTAVGVCAGSFYEVFLQQSDKAALEVILKQLFVGDAVSNSEGGSITFWSSIHSSVKAFLPILILGFCSPVLIPLLPLLPCYSVYKGFTVGFFSTLVIESLGLNGIPIIAKTLLIPTIMQICVICYLGAVSVMYGKWSISYVVAGIRKDLSQRRKLFCPDMKHYLLSYIIGTAILIISFVFQAFLLSAEL